MHTTKVLHSTSSSSRSWLSRQSRDPYVKQRIASPYRSRSAYKLLEIDTLHGLFLRPDVRAVVDLGASPGGWSQVVAEKLGWSEHGKTESKVVKVRGFGYGKRGAKLNEVYGTWSSPKLERLKGKGKEELQESQPDHFDPLNIDSGDPMTLPKGRGTIIAVDLLRMDPIHGVLDVQADFLKSETHDLIHRLLQVKGNMGAKADVILSDMAGNLTGYETRDTSASLEICHSVFKFAERHLRTAESIGRHKGGVLL